MTDKPALILENLRPIVPVRLKTCANCAAFHRYGSTSDGECRLNAPKMQIVPQPNRIGQMELKSLAGWPPIPGAGWCLEFRPKAEEMN